MNKKTAIPILTCCVAAITTLVFSNCEKKETKTASTTETVSKTADTTIGVQGNLVSAEKNSFKEVGKHLDAGGDFYLYLGTENLLQGASEKISKFRQSMLSMPDMKAEDQATMNKSFDVITRLVKNSGIEEISGVGASAIAREKGLYYNKFMVHHYPGRNSGYMWSFFGAKPHPLDGLNFLPSNTAFASFCDGDPGLIWATIQKGVSETGIPEAQKWITSLPTTFEMMTGVSLEKVLASLGGEMGIILTLDESKKVAIPVEGQKLEIPEPSILLAIKVKDDTIFNRVDQLLAGMPQVAKVDQDGVKMRTMPLGLPLPITLLPSIARSGDYMFIASTDKIIQEALKVKSGKVTGLKESAEFKRLSQGVPQQGNNFGFMSQSFGKLLVDLQKQSIQGAAKNNPAQAEWIQQFAGLSQASFGYSVSENSDEGWLVTGNSNTNSSQAILISATVFPAAMMAAIAVPNFTRARSRAQATKVLEDVRMIDASVDQWAIENNKTAGTMPNWTDLTPYLKTGSRLEKSGGKDTFGNPFIIKGVDEVPQVNPATKKALEDVAPEEFWKPY